MGLFEGKVEQKGHIGEKLGFLGLSYICPYKSLIYSRPVSKLSVISSLKKKSREDCKVRKIKYVI